MKRYWFIALGLVCCFLLLFGLVEWLDIKFLKDPAYLSGEGGLVAAGLSTLLLLADIFLPVPNSLIMIANGAMFGVVVGTVLSIIGGLGSTLIGFWIGRKSERWMNRLVTPAEKEKVSRFIERWGIYAIIITRPVPLLSETVSILAGASDISWGRMTLATCLGLLPAALIYSLTGVAALGAGTSNYAFLLVIGIAGLFWAGSKVLRKKIMHEAQAPSASKSQKD